MVRFYHLMCNNHTLICLGSSLSPGFSKRLKNELGNRLDDLNITELSNRIYLSFMGTVKLFSSTAINNSWISTNSYNETGSSIVHRKCF